MRERIRQLLDSYERWIGEPLAALADLDDAPFAVLAHGTQTPPVLWYGNQTALALWEMDFDTFTSMPSEQTAEPDLRSVRERLLARVTQDGHIRDYTGVRVSASGRRFRIHDATVWNIVDDRGDLVGQAATFDTWQFLDP